MTLIKEEGARLERRAKVSLVPEYNTLREEIGRLQNQVYRALELAILATSGVLAIAFSVVVGDELRWLILFTPALFLIPFIYLVLQCVKTTWVIGRYIELCLEPELGFQWEAFNRRLRGGPYGRFRSQFSQSLAGPLIFIQLACPVISFLSGPTDNYLWASITIGTVLIVLIELYFLRRFTPKGDMIDEMKKAMDAYRLETMMTPD